jgi:hypothetical protein
MTEQHSKIALPAPTCVCNIRMCQATDALSSGTHPVIDIPGFVVHHSLTLSCNPQPLPLGGLRSSIIIRRYFVLLSPAYEVVLLDFL